MFWKFWIEKNEIYATSRIAGQINKISIHASGQIHMHLGRRDVQRLAAPMPFGVAWLHAFELRFLVTPDAHAPPANFVKLKKNKKAFLIDVPAENVLVLNLLVGANTQEVPELLPKELGGAQTVWRARRSDGSFVILVVRVLPFDSDNEKAAAEMRAMRINTSGEPPAKPPYCEISHLFWGPGGNVVLVMPVGPEANRFDHDAHEANDNRLGTISCSDATIPITAPNGAMIGDLAIAGSGVARCCERLVQWLAATALIRTFEAEAEIIGSDVVSHHGKLAT
jgi:hypothetical protein